MVSLRPRTETKRYCRTAGRRLDGGEGKVEVKTDLTLRGALLT